MSVRAITAAMDVRGVSPTEKLLLIVLANYADEHNRCYPSQSRLADEACLSRRSVTTILGDLQARGLITRVERKRPDGSRSSDLITLHFDDQRMLGGGEAASGGVVKQLQGGGEAASHLTTFEPSFNQSSSSSSSSPRARAPSFDQTEWGERFEQAKEAAGDAADLTRPAMLHCRDLRALVEPSSGEPCDWGEVLDAIRMVAARQRTRGKLITTWAWVRDDAIALRDKRLSGNPEPQTHTPHAKPTSLADELATQKANARRRVLEMTEGRDNDQSC